MVIQADVDSLNLPIRLFVGSKEMYAPLTLVETVVSQQEPTVVSLVT